LDVVHNWPNKLPQKLFPLSFISHKMAPSAFRG
jgi:hypothetical protein